jgi:hypothetical protein
MDTDTTMDDFKAMWEAKKEADGWTLERLGIEMGYPKPIARQSAAQFLRAKRPQLATVRKFLDAIGNPMQSPQQTTAEPLPAAMPDTPRVLPFDPLTIAPGHLHFRRTIVGVLESYNSAYDAVAEAVQNSMDALEDAAIHRLPGPYLLEVTVDLKNNILTVLDTGIGMTQDQVCQAFAPASTFKEPSFAQTIFAKRGQRHSYRGYKGVGLTFLAYGTNQIWIQSVRDGQLVKGHMQEGRTWAVGTGDVPPRVEIDNTQLGLDKVKRGTAVRIAFSGVTRPTHLSNLGTTAGVWEAILRTRTAAGQVLLNRDPIADFKVKLVVVKSNGQRETKDIKPEFYYPHLVSKNPEFRFLDVWQYHKDHAGVADIPPTAKRQDGIYLTWNTDEIRKQLGDRETDFRDLIELHKPDLYAFRPYQKSVYTELRDVVTGQTKTTHFFDDGLVVAVDRQRLAEVTPIKATKSAFLAEQMFVLFHFDQAKPDYGRKTLQLGLMDLAQTAANAAVRYMAGQSSFLKGAGEKSTEAQREVEANHEDWVYNVKKHAESKPLSLPSVAYASEPMTEQDVIGLFNQFCALGLFPGMRVFATSASRTYDCYVQFDLKDGLDRLRYKSVKETPLALSSEVFGPSQTRYNTRGLTLEFKNNLDGLISDLEDQQSGKTFAKVDLLVCWGTVEPQHKHYELTAIDESNLEERRYPGVTHVLRKDGEASHAIQVIMLEQIVRHVQAGHIRLK